MADAVHADGFLGPSPPSSGFSGSFFPKIAIDTSRDGADATPSCVPAASPVREVLLNGVVEKGARGEKPSATIAMPTTRRTTVLRMLWDDTYVRGVLELLPKAAGPLDCEAGKEKGPFL